MSPTAQELRDYHDGDLSLVGIFDQEMGRQDATGVSYWTPGQAVELPAVQVEQPESHSESFEDWCARRGVDTSTTPRGPLMEHAVQRVSLAHGRALGRGAAPGPMGRRRLGTTVGKDEPMSTPTRPIPYPPVPPLPPQGS